MTLLELGKTKVHEILEIPGTWTQGKAYRDENGKSCPIENAVCGCIYGLIDLIYRDKWLEQEAKLCQKIHGVVKWNDTPGRTQEEVLALCKELDI